MASIFKAAEYFLPADEAYTLLPFRFIRLDAGRYVAVNEVGEWQTLTRPELESLVRKELPGNTPFYYSLKSKHFIQDRDSDVALDLLALKMRTKRHRIAEFTSLHMFVVTLRCNHSCKYCQVSRQSEDRIAFDMTAAMADKAIDFTFCSPAKAIKIEFQGGEPLLNFELIKHIILKAEDRNKAERRHLAFVIATNLSVLSEEILNFCKQHDILISTSLDGPEDLHNATSIICGSLWARHNSSSQCGNLTYEPIWACSGSFVLRSPCK